MKDLSVLQMEIIDAVYFLGENDRVVRVSQVIERMENAITRRFDTRLVGVLCKGLEDRGILTREDRGGVRGVHLTLSDRGMNIARRIRRSRYGVIYVVQGKRWVRADSRAAAKLTRREREAERERVDALLKATPYESVEPRDDTGGAYMPGRDCNRSARSSLLLGE